MSAPQNNPVDQHNARIGEVLDERWRLERLLGAGASAGVYEARHRNGNRVAVKILHESLAGHPVACNRLYAEARIANRIAHPNLVRVYDDGRTKDGCPFLVMELLEGLSVEQQLLVEQLPLARALEIADQVLDALAAAHAAGVTHLDVKPANIFCCPDGTVRLLDFGVSASTAEGVGPYEGIAVGTPAFMSPEQTRGHWSVVDGRSDLWSVGATLFTMIAGRPVRQCNSTYEALRIAGSEPVISLRAVSDAPDEVVELVDRALQFDCRKRFASAQDMQSALRRVLAGLSEQERLYTATSVSDSRNASIARADGCLPQVEYVGSLNTVTLEQQRGRHWTVPVLAAAAFVVVCFVPPPASWLLDMAGVAYVAETSTPTPMPPAPSPMTVAAHQVSPKELAPLLSRDTNASTGTNASRAANVSGDTNDDSVSSNGSSLNGTAKPPAAAPSLGKATKGKVALQRRHLRRTDARRSTGSAADVSEPVDANEHHETFEPGSNVREDGAKAPFDPLAQRL